MAGSEARSVPCVPAEGSPDFKALLDGLLEPASVERALLHSTRALLLLYRLRKDYKPLGDTCVEMAEMLL